MVSFCSFGQTNSYLGLNGGFEGTATIDNTTTGGTAVANKWGKANTNATIAGETTTVRSGANSLKVTSSTSSTCRVFSPLMTISASTTAWQVQYYRRATSTTATIQNQTGSYRNGSETLNGSYTTVSATNTWEKVTYSPASTTSATTAAADVLVKMMTSAGDMYYDDFVLYESGSIDVTAANPATSAATANPSLSTLDVSWTAASGGVDGGGYIVVRGTADPTTAPNVNGIYAVGNTIAAGMTVVFQGTGTSFTDTGLSSGTTYFYRVYSYDKAYNYSAANTCSGTTSAAGSPSLAITGTTAHGSSCPTVAATPITYTITNSGSVTAAGVTVVSNDAQFVVSGLSSTTIAGSGGTATYVVTFTPSSSGAKTATITVASTTSGSNSPTSSLTGTGTTAVTATVTSSAASSILSTSATLNGNVTALGVCPATTSKGFVYSVTSTNANPLNGGTGVTTTSVAGVSTGAYVLALTGLASATNYTFKAYVFDGVTYTYGTALTFTTLGVPVVSSASPTGTSGTAFSYSIVATNTPTSYAVASGTLPTGLSLNTSTGAITGTPTASGSSSITVTATNGAGTSTPVTISFTIASGPCLSANFDSSTSVPSGWSGTSSNDTGSTHYQSASNCRGLGTGINLITASIDNPTSIDFYVDASSSQTGTLEYRIGAGAWTSIGTFAATSAGSTANFPLTSAPDLSGTTGVSFRISSPGNTIYIDDLNAYCNPTTITLTPTTLTGFTYALGSGPSANQTFTASGSGLTADILLTPPTDYEISTAAGSGFGSTITLTQSGGTVSATTIYVRLKTGLTVNSYNSETIAASSTGATTKNVTCSGTVTGTGPTITLTPTTLTGFSYLSGSGPSSNQTFTASGVNLTADILLTPPTDYEISTASGSGFGSTVTLTQSGGTVSVTTIYVRLKAGLAIGSYNSEVIAATSASATTQNVTCSGSVSSSGPCLSSSFDSSTSVPSGWSGTSTNDTGSTHIQSSSNCRALINGNNLITSAIDNPISIDFYVDASSGGNGGTGTLEYRVGAGAWTSVGTFVASTAGATVTFALTSSPNLSATANVSFRISSAASTIYIDDLNAYCNSVAGPTITLNPTTLTGFSYIFGSGPSANQTFTASGNNLTADILLTPPTDYEISTDSGSGFGSTITLTQSGGVVNATTIYVRLKVGLAAANYNTENVAATSAGATTKNETCSGTVNTSTNSITSDIIAVASSESTTVSSMENDATITTTADGAQVWQFTIRDGGTVVDSDALATIVNSITLTQNSGNAINDWADAIEVVALFNGTTKIADGVVTSTGITFTGAPLISVPDNGSVTLTIRLSIQINPNNTGGNLDGDDFVFSIDHANLTESAAGSQFKSSGVVSSTNGQDVLTVVATNFVYTQQPTNTGQNATMTSVKITGTDANGNKDLGYTGVVSITSTGTMTGSPLTATAIAGVATFSSIIHSVQGTGYTLSASGTGITTSISPVFDITGNTTFQPGELAILAVNTSAATSSSEDEISFVCFVDILPGTTFYLTDNGYERLYTGLWGNGEGIISLMRTTSTLPKGTIITIHTVNGGVYAGTDFTISTCGSIDSNWTKGIVAGGVGGGNFDLNRDDQVWITQGGTWGNATTLAHDMTYNGNVLYGWTDIPWKTDINYASTKGSTIVPKRECYTTDVANPITTASRVKFNDPVNPDFSTLTNGRIDWIGLINNPANWDYYTTDANYDAGGYNYIGSTTCPAMTMGASTYVNGRWTGKIDTNWFNCSNWDTLTVPDETVDVTVVDTSYDRQANVNYAAAYADYYGNIALAKNLTITGEKVEIVANTNNKLEVHGNLSIGSAGSLDMDDSNSATADGQLYLYGNWTNSVGNSAFQEGNGTVRFLGSSAQVISNVTPEGTETFYNLVLGNNFDTSVSNDIIASKDLTISSGKTLTIASNDFAEVGYNVTNSGTLNIANNGSLIQTNDAGVDTGNISMQRTATIRTLDYVYWSSPVSNFSVSNVSPTSSLIYKWVPTVARSYASNFGGWAAAGGETMVIGKGYIIRGPGTGTNAVTAEPYSATFTNVPNNGVVTVGIERSTWDGADYTYSSGANTLTVKNDDDNYNLLGNPYPSAIDVHSFLATNTNLAGYVKLWSHGTALSNTNGQSFYNSFPYTYTASDYVTYNETGLSAGPTDYAIPAGQGFFVTMNHSSAATSENVTFNNSMRNKTYKNNAFYRQANRGNIERHRIWLDIVDTSGRTVRTMVGYIQDATLHKDRLFDANIKVDSNLNIYSLINDEAHIIQGRPLPFDINDKISLGVSTPVKMINGAPSQNTYTIAIGVTDGLFRDTRQNIYLEDKLLNIIHDLRQAPYTFTTVGGRLDDRFVLRYTNGARLDATDFSKLDRNVVVASADRQIKIKSYLEDLKNITVYDVLGREVFKKNNINAMEFYVNDIILSQQALIIKIVLANGQTVTRKIIY
ncbi:hypothetical protein DB895_07575 [Flavobacterium psychrotolerans]|uniref:Fibronectin type-III domain-containing protein n=2 Tax=Flavobacterium psychrotolerans TaxID=2169410 RepID=A0A2U1JJ09_9FLAO|nr:hypothetical protein DB895_07575 [Flavobacterium psychrotolerans]